MAEAAGAGAGGEEPLLQVPLTEFQLTERLKITVATSAKEKQGNQLLNCANLTIVLLGLVTKPENYLLKCYDRSNFTEMYELNTILSEAFKKANVKYKGANYNEPLAHTVTVETSMKLPWGDILKTIGEKLKYGYATPLGITFKDKSQHLVVLRKNLGGILELIDPQQIDPRTQTYPLRRTIQLFNWSPYPQRITEIICFGGPVLPMSKQNIAKSSYSESIMHITKKGGKQKTRKQRKRRKTRSG